MEIRNKSCNEFAIILFNLYLFIQTNEQILWLHFKSSKYWSRVRLIDSNLAGSQGKKDVVVFSPGCL